MKHVAIVGPTGSGKSDIALALAKRIGGEIICMDSMQIYKGMDIGTAKTTQTEGIAHHMVDIVDPWEDYSVSMYREGALAALADIESRGKTAIFCGGTGLYLKSILYGLNLGNVPGDKDIRDALEAEYDVKGGAHMLEKLRAIDSKTPLHPNDKRRILRALEIYALTGSPKLPQNLKKERDIPVFAPLWDRKTLYQRVDHRVDLMMEQGLLAEAQHLFDVLKEHHALKSTAAQAIGYKELFDYFNGFCDLNAAVDLIKQRTRNYAKRQMTWFSKEDLVWL